MCLHLATDKTLNDVSVTSPFSFGIFLQQFIPLTILLLLFKLLPSSSLSTNVSAFPFTPQTWLI